MADSAVERVARAIAYDVRPPKLDHLNVFDYWHTLAVEDMETFRGQAQAAIDAHLLYLHETAHRVVMDGEGNVEAEKREVRN